MMENPGELIIEAVGPMRTFCETPPEEDTTRP